MYKNVMEPNPDRNQFPTLAYKDKLRNAEWTVAERHITPSKIVKLGKPEKPGDEPTEDK